jgi:hypothetical protein
VTIEEVRERLAIIRRNADDDEKAHALEDALHQDVIRYFAATGNEVAKEAIRSLEIEFSRSCA